MVTSSVGSNKLSGKANSLNEFLKNQALNQGLHRPIVSSAPNLSSSAVSTAATNTSVPFIFTATPTKLTTSSNGVNQVCRTVSMPHSLLDMQKQQVSRSQSNPFFTIPLKEPPKYDDAVRSKQQQQQHSPVMLGDASTAGQGSTASQVEEIKSQAMDDVLEILIRNGDLPPSAADEPLPTPKTTEAQPLPPLPTTATLTQQAALAMSGGTNIATSTSPYGLPLSNLSCPSSLSPQPLLPAPSPPVTLGLGDESFLTSMDMGINTSVADNTLPIVHILPPVTAEQRMQLNNELLDLTEMLSGDLNTMEWTSDAGFVGLDLHEASMHLGSSGTVGNMGSGDGGYGSNMEQTLSVPTSSYNHSGRGSINGSEPDLASLGLGETECDGDGAGMQIDVSDWLDVIMPSTGLTPLSTNAPVSFSADPILTPKTQQEVLDLFNFDDGDFTAPSDHGNIISWNEADGT